MGPVGDLVRARARHRPAGAVLVALGVLLAAALPVAAAATGRLVSSAALEHGLQALDPGRRSVTVSINGLLDRADLALADRAVRDQLGRLAGEPPRRQVVFRRISDGRGVDFVLGGTDDLPGAVRLTEGRLPRGCTPTRCEVVAVGAAARPGPDLGLVVVGRAVRTDPLLLSGTFDPGPGVPLLIADGVTDVARLDSLSLFQRTYGWVAPIDLERVRRDGVPTYLRASTDVGDQLWRRLNGLIVTAPDDVLKSEDDRAAGSGERFALLGALGVVLALGLAVVGAVGVRRDHLAAVRTLWLRGASRRVLATFTLGEAAWPVLLGAVLGPLLALGVAALAAAATGSPVAPTLGTGLAGGAPFLVVLVPLAIALVAGTLRLQPGGGERAAWHGVELAVAVLAGAALLLVARGGTGVSGEGDAAGTLLVALPVLVVCAGALLAARLTVPLVRAASRLGARRRTRRPSHPGAVRLALVGPLRRPLRAATTVAVLTAAVAGVVFAAGYRATLAEGAADQAAYAVPVDAVLRTGPDLASPARVATPQAVAALPGDVAAHPVVRTGAVARLSSVQNAPVQVLGLDPAALEQVARWRPDYSSAGPAAVADRVAVRAAAAGTLLPAGRELTLAWTGSLTNVEVVALLRTSAGAGLPVTLGTSTGTRGTLRAALPTDAGPLRLASLVLRETSDEATRRQHAMGEGNRDLPARTGTVVLGAPRVGGAAVGALSGWQPAGDRSTARPAGEGLAVAYRIAGDTTTLRPAASAAPVRVLPALVDDRTAALARAGRLDLDLGEAGRLRLEVVATGERFPTTSGRFVVVDRTALARLLDDASPGTGTAAEVWLTGTDVPTDRLAAALDRAPFDALATDLRATREEALRTDPVARGASYLLLVAALVGLLVAAVAVLLLVVSERREAAAELFALEADGLAPSVLRRVLLWRAVAVVLVGVPAGLAVGALLAGAVSGLVELTAAGTAPVPPLRLAVSPGLAGTAVAAALAVGIGGAALVAARSLREPLPVRPEVDLR